MEAQLLLLCLSLLTNMAIAVPLTERRAENYYTNDENIKMASGDQGIFDEGINNEYDIVEDIPVPQYMTALYECWQKKDEEQEMKNCLQSVDEVLEVDEIVNSTNTITGFIGQGVPANENSTGGPQYQQVSFNISCVEEMHENLLSSELRFYKERMDFRTLQTLSSNICPLSDKGVVLSLLVDLNHDGQDHLVQSITLSTENLLTERWVVFHRFRSIISEWIQNHKDLNNRTFKLVLQGGCASIHPQEIGFGYKEDPLLVMFLKGNNPSIDEQVMKRISAKLAEAESVVEKETRKKRQIEIEDRKADSSPFCKLHHYNINFTALGYTDFIIGPKEYQANYCAGICPYPLLDHQNGTLHSKMIAHAHYKDPNHVPGPCCVPTMLHSQSLIVKLNKFAIQIKTYPKMVAKHCGCR